MTKVYGVEIGKMQKAYYDLTNKDKLELVEKYSEPNGDVYTPEAFFYYLNQDGIDTENYYWFLFDTFELEEI